MRTCLKTRKNLQAESHSKPHAPPPDAFYWPVRVYFEDTDAGAVVYHASYVRFFERARTEWLREKGFAQSRLASEYGVLFAVRAMQLEFIKPARFDDALQVSVYGIELGRASFKLNQTVERDKEILCHAKVKIASVDAEQFRPKPIPDAITKEIDA